MPSSAWETTTLGTLAHVEMGQSPASELVSESEGSGVPFLQGNAEFSALHPTPRLWCRKPPKMCRRGDSLISVRAPVGAINRADQDYCIGRGLAAVRFTGANADFGYHALAYFSTALRRVAQGTTFEAVGGSDLRSLSVPRCDRAEQDRIAAILDTLDDAIRRTEQVIVKLQQTKQGLLHDLLTRGVDEKSDLRPSPAEAPHLYKDSPLGRIPREWAAPFINDLAVHVGSGVTPRGGSDTYVSSGVLFIRSQNVHFDGLHLDDIAFIDEVTHRAMARSEVFPNDVLLNITGASIGRCCPVPDGLGMANVNQHVCAIRIPKPTSTDALYLSAFLASPFGQHQVDVLNAGSNRQGLNYQQVRAFRVLWPEGSERDRIAAAITAHDERDQRERRNLEKLGILKNGLLHDLLTGRVRVPLPADAPA